MRAPFACALAGLVCLTAAAVAQDQPVVPRFGVTGDLENYPQATPKEALASIVKAVGRGRYDYLVAHLLDPAFVDRRLGDTKVSPEQLAKSVQTHLAEDPDLLRDLKRFLAEGEMTDGADTAVFRHKDVKDRAVFLRKAGERWFMENRRLDDKQPAKE